MRLTDAYHQFLEQMRVERDWTPRTRASYCATYDALAAVHEEEQEGVQVIHRPLNAGRSTAEAMQAIKEKAS
jgi:hypothetical protein